MLNSIKKIMKKADETGKDIGVACDMLVYEGEDLQVMKKAMKIYTKSYEEICELKNKGDWDNLAKVVELTEKKKYDEIKELMKEIKGE